MYYIRLFFLNFVQMKKFFTLMILLALGTAAFAQSTTWPYLFPEFQEGTVYFKDKAAATQKVNIHLFKGNLHYLDAGGVVREALMVEVIEVEIGADKYVNMDGTLVKVLVAGENGCVAQEVLGDLDVPKKQYAARNPSVDYRGTSDQAFQTTAKQQAEAKVSVLELQNMTGKTEAALAASKKSGRPFELVTKNYVIAGGQNVVATKKGVSDWLPQDRKDAWKAWQKDHKIKWNEPESLLQIADFVVGK